MDVMVTKSVAKHRVKIVYEMASDGWMAMLALAFNHRNGASSMQILKGGTICAAFAHSDRCTRFERRNYSFERT